MAKTAQSNEDSFVAKVLEGMNILLNEHLEDNPDKDPSDYKFSIKLNKKSLRCISNTSSN